MKVSLKTILRTLALVAFVCCLALSTTYFWLIKPSERELWRITKFDRIDNLTIIGDLLFFEGYKKDGSTECICVYAVDKMTGKTKWSTEELSQPYVEKEKKLQTDPGRIPGINYIISFSEPKDIIYIMMNFEILFALRSGNGEVIWQRDFSGMYPLSLYDSFSNDSVFIIDSQRNLVALDKITGEELWKTSVFLEPDQLTGLTYNNDVIYANKELENSEQFLAFDARTGRKIWETTVRLIFPFSAISENVLFSSNLNGWDSTYIYLTSYNLSTGQPNWEVPLEMFTQDLLETTVVEDQVYIVIDKIQDNQYRESRLVALNRQTGELVWQFNENYSFGIVSYLISNRIIYAGASDGHVVALDNKTGRLIWKGQTLASPFYMVIDQDSLIVVDDKDYISALDTKTGSQKWILSLDTKMVFYDIEEAIKIEDGILFVSSKKPMIYAVNIDDGNVLWLWNHDRLFPWHRGYSLSLTHNGIIYVVSDDGASIVSNSGLFALKAHP